MSELCIYSIVINKYRHYSSNKPVTEKDNILNQDFNATGINQKWCTDITYIHTQKDGWTYLASVMDLYSRKIIGWAYDTNISAELALKAVKNACLGSFHSLIKKKEIYRRVCKGSKKLMTASLNTLNPGIIASELIVA